ncbi:MAG: hypothetical protein WCT32_02005 [Patescibacteria group bacterium]|jgi:hypothetical protein
MSVALDKLALIVSAITSPFLVVSFFCLLMVRRYSTTPEEMLLWGSTFIAISIIIPLAYIFREVRAGRISDMHIRIREQRIKPFLVSIGSTLMLLVIYYTLGVPRELLAMLAAILANGIIFLFITRYWKASIHLAALAGTITMTSLLVDQKITLIFVLLPIVAWARMRRNRHTLWQTAVGSLISLGVTFIIIRTFQ